jgi:hypothetical protein
MALNKDRLREVARRAAEGKGTEPSNGPVDINVLRDAAQPSVAASSGSSGAGWIWLIIIAAVWFFFGQFKEKEAVPVPTASTADPRAEAPTLDATAPSDPVADAPTVDAAAPADPAADAPTAGAAAPPTPAEEAPTADAGATHESEVIALINNVVRANHASIETVLGVAAGTTDSSTIETAALQAGRAYKYGNVALTRDLTKARQFNAQALNALNERHNPVEVCKLQTSALMADPFDTEIAGNTAICLFKLGRTGAAQRVAIYALSLPRGENASGRIADWTTLASTYAETGEAAKANQAMFVTLALVPDHSKLCYSAVYSVKNTYGVSLQAPTEAMFERIRDNQLSEVSECALPIAW